MSRELLLKYGCCGVGLHVLVCASQPSPCETRNGSEQKVCELKETSRGAPLWMLSVAMSFCLASTTNVGALPDEGAQPTDLTPDEAISVTAEILGEAEALTNEPGGFLVEGPTATVAIPDSSDGLVAVTSGTGTSDVSIALPGEAVEGTAVADAVAFPEVAEDTTLVVQVPDEGVVTMAAVLSSEAAPDQQRYRLDTSEDARFVPNSDGSITVWVGNDEVGLFAAPWAIDASGAPLPTQYSIDGDTLVQTTDLTDAEFPVVVDPS